MKTKTNNYYAVLQNTYEVTKKLQQITPTKTQKKNLHNPNTNYPNQYPQKFLLKI